MSDHFARLQAGKLYDAMDADIQKRQKEALRALAAFNQAGPDQRQQAMEAAFAHVGKNVLIEGEVRANFGGRFLSLGNNVYINFGFTLVGDAPIVIEDDVLIGPNVTIATAGHPLDPQLRKTGWQYALPVRIEAEAWIGAGAILLPGVCIGRGSVIGAGSVVTKSVPAGVVAAGNPCRVLRPLAEADRFSMVDAPAREELAEVLPEDYFEVKV